MGNTFKIKHREEIDVQEQNERNKDHLKLNYAGFPIIINFHERIFIIFS
jgi:hypothetical protein